MCCVPKHLIDVFNCRAGGGTGGQAAKDALGNDIKAESWLATHPKGDRNLSQGLKVRSDAFQCCFQCSCLEVCLLYCFPCLVG